jgi:hypothetical protein
MRLPLDRAVSVLRLLLEGNSIRATERLTGTNRNTVMALLVQVGERCEAFTQAAVVGVRCERWSADEPIKENDRRSAWDRRGTDQAFYQIALKIPVSGYLAWPRINRKPLPSNRHRIFNNTY